MARVRRAAVNLLAATLVVAAAATLVVAAAAPAGLVLAGGAPPGSLILANRSAGPIMIARAIGVERRDGTSWTAVRTEFNAVSSCPMPGRPAPAPTSVVSIPTGRSLKVVPWQGYTCSGQCEAACMANLYLGPGTFRFVATVLPVRARVLGPSFALPPQH